MIALDRGIGGCDPGMGHAGPLRNRLDPALSCRGGLTINQRRVLCRVFLVSGILGLFYPVVIMWTLGVIVLIIFLAMLLVRLFLTVYGFLAVVFQPCWASILRPGISLWERANQSCPVYSILVPVYDEAPVIAQLAAALCKLNWPAECLDIQILLEEDDETTRRAARAAAFPAGTRLTIVPAGGPKTKPNALNVGLDRIRGTFVCVFDAEDRPHPDQLLEAYWRFSRADRALACLQAPLIGRGVPGSWISAQWSLEYLVNFKLIQPALARLGLPVSLGGTSNHFRTSVLRNCGGWDAWNVTEDADLGYRLLRRSFKLDMITAPTFEDGPDRLTIWLCQRSRWIKGFMKTWGVLMRDPRRLLRELGLVRFVCLHLTLGSAILGPFLAAPLILAFGLSLSLGVAWSPMGWALLCAGLTVLTLGDILALRFQSRNRVALLMTRWLYWPLHTLAAIKAVWELVRCPWFWAKTPHTPSIEGEKYECWTGLSV